MQLLITLLLIIARVNTQPIQLNYGTYLFLDDSLIQNYKGAYFEQHAPVKTGPVITPEYEWETGIYFYTSTLKVNETDYRIYYTCMGLDNYRTNTINLCLAVSKDGISFYKPFLGIIGYGVNNNTKNNIVYATPLGGWPNTVWLDLKPGIPKNEIFKLTYDDPDRLLKIASSPDGINWQWLASPGIASQFADTQTVIVYDSNLQDYVAYGRRDDNNGRDDSCPGNYNSYRNIVRSVSTGNMSEFGPPIQVFSWDSLDPPCVDPYNPATVLYPSDPYIYPYIQNKIIPNTNNNNDKNNINMIPNTYFLFPAFTFHLTNVSVPFVDSYTAMYGKNDNLLDIHFIYSYNGINFSYVTKEPFIERGIGMRNFTSGMYNSPNADWDSGFVFMTRGMFPTPTNPNTLTMYYFGTQMTHTTAAYITNANVTNALKGIGRAELRRDGFVSLTTMYNLPMPQAAITTKPMLLPNASLCDGELQLQLNIDTSVSGNIVVELSDTSGNVITGFSSSDCVPIKGNFIRVPVTWYYGGVYNSDLSKISRASQAIVLSFTASHTKIYAMEIICVGK